MREFSNIEKEIMDYICSLDVLNENIAISSIITKFCHCSFQCQEEALCISYNETKYSDKEIIDNLLSVICLFEYLQSQSLIYVFLRKNVCDRLEIINASENHVKFGNTQISEQRTIKLESKSKISINGKTYTLGDSATGINPLSKIIIPWNIVDLFMTYANSVIFCTETLRHLQTQNYLSDSTIQFNKSRCQTWWAIGISFLVGVAGICGNYVSYSQNERFHKEDLEQVKKYVIIHDTIKDSIHNVTTDTLTVNSKVKTDKIK